jgi:hypothetical protein
VLIPVIWAFYPETSRRTLESIDLLFVSESPFNGKMEEGYRMLSAEALESGKEVEKNASEDEVWVDNAEEDV